MPQRLPTLGETPYKAILDGFLRQEHNADGTHGAITASGQFALGTPNIYGLLAGDFIQKNNRAYWFENAAGSGVVRALSVGAGDAVILGDTSLNKDLFIFTGGAGDILLEAGGVTSTTGRVRLGSITGGVPTEVLTVIGSGSFEPTSGSIAQLRFLAGAGGGKNWRIGTGLNTPGLFEIQDTSDSASSYLTIDTAGSVKVVTSGLQIGAPTGSDKGSGTVNAAGGFYLNNSLLLGAKDTSISTGVGSIKMKSANAATNAAWVPITTSDGTVYFVPGWTTNNP